jgi:shikimate kinase
MDGQTRANIRARGISIWLRADLELLVARVARRSNRPLLKGGDVRSILAALIEKRYPIYAEADITVDSIDGPPELTLTKLLEQLEAYVAQHYAPAAEAAR